MTLMLSDVQMKQMQSMNDNQRFHFKLDQKSNSMVGRKTKAKMAVVLNTLASQLDEQDKDKTKVKKEKEKILQIKNRRHQPSGRATENQKQTKSMSDR